MIYKSVNSTFPSQVVPDEVKQSYEYGSEVAKAIENEWFKGDRGAGSGGRFGNNWQNFHRLRLYARGEQSVQKYKDELSTNGDLSYLNLDWQPVAVLSKFLDIVVNGMTDKGYKIKSFATDPYAQKQRTDYTAAILRDMNAKKVLESIKNNLGADLFMTAKPDELPTNKEELDLYVQLNYKQSVEIAEEEVIDNILEFNRYEEVKKRVARLNSSWDR